MKLKRKTLQNIGENSPDIGAISNEKSLSIIGDNGVELDADNLDKIDPILGGFKSGGISKEKLAERNEYIIGLYTMGMSAKTVLNQVNKAALEKGWGILEDEGSIRKLVSKHFKEKIPDGNARVSYFEGLKEAAYAQQESIIEKLALHIRNKTNWKDFEKQDALEKLFKMQQLLIENRNWNDSRANPLININNTTNQLNVFSDGATGIANSPQAGAVLGRIFSKLSEKFESQDL